MEKLIEEKIYEWNNPTSKYSEEEYNKNNEKFWKKYNNQALELV